MRLAILVPYFPPRWLAGTELATYHMAKILAKKNDVHVVTFRDQGLPEFSEMDNFCVHRISYRKIRFYGGIMASMKNVVTLKVIKPDIVHAQDISMGLSAFLYKKIAKKPYLVWGRGNDVYFPGYYKKYLFDLVLKNASMTIAQTKHMQTTLKATYLIDAIQIPNGIELKSQGFVDIRKQFGIHKDEIVVITVGNLKKIKGINYLIEALCSVKKIKKIKAFIIGDGTERAALEKMAVEMGLKNDVYFLGRMENEVVLNYMKNSDIFVLPSLSEGFPNVILEAMSCSLPIIATRVNGIPEIINDSVNGFLVNPQNPSDIAGKIISLIENKNLRNSISINNRSEILKYDWNNIVERINNVYDAILKGHDICI